MTMQLLKFYVILSCALVLNPADVVGQASLAADQKTVTVLKQFRDAFSKAMVENRPELFQGYYDDNIRLMPPFQKTILGKKNSLLYHELVADRFTIRKFARTELEILDLGAQILETGAFTIHLKSKNSDEEQLLEGKYMTLWSQVNNDLRVITDAWNHDRYYGKVHEDLRIEAVPSVHLAMHPNVPINSNISFELAALNRLLDATVTQHDGTTWSQYYCEDGILMASNYPICRGKKDIDAYIKLHANELPVFEELDIRNDRIDNLGTYVVEYASHIASWRSGDSSGVSLGKNIRIWRREPDHSLKLFRSIGMYD